MTIEEQLLDSFALVHAPLNVSIPIVALRRYWSMNEEDFMVAVDALVKKGLLVMTGDRAALTAEGHALIYKHPTTPPPFAISRASGEA